MNDDKQKTICYTVRDLPKSLHTELKIKAATLDISMKELIIELLLRGVMIRGVHPVGIVKPKKGGL